MASIDLPVMLAAAVLCMPLFFVGARLTRFEGALFLALYVAYVWYMIAVAVAAGYLPGLQSAILYGLVPAVVLYIAGSLIWDLSRRRSRRAG